MRIRIEESEKGKAIVLSLFLFAREVIFMHGGWRFCDPFCGVGIVAR
ncbi:hypothetical protein B4119_1380 [Parageobacillus caldoxylosilyticus]|uniref:Uncharacterized protein n=1 Tax=Saccharococcus caldoxylosilyticus TaxID=81408 RepID=A0A150M3P1_9BACL|nr:hypothetical protein B4119_1380 [Parageobacillus caldoxylosilyticus]